MGCGLFEINFSKNNIYTDKFNESMRYMIEQLPELVVEKEIDNVLLVRSLSEQATALIEWLDGYCLSVTELMSEE